MSNLKEVRERVRVEYRHAVTGFYGVPDEPSSSIDRRQLVEWLDEALKYKQHDYSCPRFDPGGDCTCGLDEFIARLGAP